MEEKVKIAKEVAEKITEISGVSTAVVDDFNRFGDFQVVAYLDLYKNNKPKSKDFNIRKVSQQIKRIIKETKEISKIGIRVDVPKRMYDKYTCLGTTDCYFKGYERSYIMIDFVVINLNEQVSITELLV